MEQIKVHNNFLNYDDLEKCKQIIKDGKWEYGHNSDNNNKMAILTMSQLKHGRNFPKKRCLGQRTQSLLENAKYTWKPTSTRYFLRSVWMLWARGG